MLVSVIIWLTLCYLVVYILLRLTLGIARSATCLIGKTALVTGGNSGIGYEVCLNLASRGCRVIIADVEDSTTSRQSIIRATNNPSIVSKHLDLSSFQSIRSLAQDLSQGDETIDILINNAGTGGCSEEMSQDGLNRLLQINFFGPFLLTHLTVPLLRKSSGGARIVFTSSGMCFLGRFDYRNWNKKGHYTTILDHLRAYADSKLATLIASDSFADKLKRFNITCNALHPGTVRTAIFERAQRARPEVWTWAAVARLGYFLWKDPWEGAQTSVYLAVAEEVEGVSGGYFWDCARRLKPPQAVRRSRDEVEEFWRFCEDCVKLDRNLKI